jgi:hypothetical protein
MASPEDITFFSAVDRTKDRKGLFDSERALEVASD